MISLSSQYSQYLAALSQHYRDQVADVKSTRKEFLTAVASVVTTVILVIVGTVITLQATRPVPMAFYGFAGLGLSTATLWAVGTGRAHYRCLRLAGSLQEEIIYWACFKVMYETGRRSNPNIERCAAQDFAYNKRQTEARLLKAGYRQPVASAP
jgi:hypothetical protein